MNNTNKIIKKSEIKKENNKKLKSNHGITLITLIVTIILMMILASIVINLAIRKEGIFEKTQYAKEKYLNAQVDEEKNINDLYSEIMIATNDNAQVTLSVKELKELIKEQVQNEIKENRGIFIDYDNLLTTITTAGASWTATEDCAVISKIITVNAYSVSVYVDGKPVHTFSNGVETGKNGSAASTIIYLKKGSVITTDPPERTGRFDISIYGLK